jgi:hypothetical protein
MLRKFGIRVKLHGKEIRWDLAYRPGRIIPEQWIPINIYAEYELFVLHAGRPYEFLIRRDRQPIRSRPGAAPGARHVQATNAGPETQAVTDPGPAPITRADIQRFINGRLNHD